MGANGYLQSFTQTKPKCNKISGAGYKIIDEGNL